MSNVGKLADREVIMALIFAAVALVVLTFLSPIDEDAPPPESPSTSKDAAPDAPETPGEPSDSPSSP